MVKKSKYTKVQAYLARPWFIETLIFFLVLWQESFRLSARTGHKILPIKIAWQNYYYYNFGDFVNGYVMAFILDGLVNVIIIKENKSFKLINFALTKTRSALLAVLISSSIVVGFELIRSNNTTSDVNDIPAGIIGAFLYYVVRLCALNLNEKYLKAN